MNASEIKGLTREDIRVGLDEVGIYGSLTAKQVGKIMSRRWYPANT